ncbi:MAG: protein-tyrosine phosphatase family protein [Parvibaculum sp.]|uniref:tyrosine phosphatase family protein n=1 Tax=Parvibaculum sp. TaxID=2024848 RepID=UPI003C7898FD
MSPLSGVADAIRTVGPSHLVSLLDPETMIDTPQGIDAARHLRLSVNDIAEPNEMLVSPSEAHVSQLIGFIRRWDQRSPMLVHCWAGISRSTAAAFIALCTLNENHPEDDLARLVRARGSHAYPNRLMVRLADDILGRKGRMRAAVEALGPARATWEGELFALPVHPGS